MRVYKYRRDFDNDTSDPRVLHRYTNYYYFIKTLRENIFTTMYKLMLLIVAAMALIAAATGTFIYTYPAHHIATYPSVYTYPAYHYPLAYSSAYPSAYTLLRR